MSDNKAAVLAARRSSSAWTARRTVAGEQPTIAATAHTRRGPTWRSNSTTASASRRSLRRLRSAARRCDFNRRFAFAASARLSII